MTELANFMASGMPGNYSAVGSYGLNPYDPRRDPRDSLNDGRPVMSVAGSSSGIGTAMSFWAANVGTETRGSILSPSDFIDEVMNNLELDALLFPGRSSAHISPLPG